MPGSLYGAYPKKLPVRFKLPSHLDLLRFQRAKVKDRHLTQIWVKGPVPVIHSSKTTYLVRFLAAFCHAFSSAGVARPFLMRNS